VAPPKIMAVERESRPQPNSIVGNRFAMLKKANWAISHKLSGTL